MGRWAHNENSIHRIKNMAQGIWILSTYLLLSVDEQLEV